MNKEKKNIAIVCHDYTLSGANYSLLDWLKKIGNSEKYNIICIIPRNGIEFEKICKENGILVIRGNYLVTTKHLYRLPIKNKIKNIIKNILKILINPISFMVLKKKLTKLNVELIHSNSFAITFGVKLAMKMNIPHVWHVREFMEEDHRITHFESKKKLDKYCKYSNAIFISDVIKDKYNDKFKNKLKRVIYDKVDFDNNYNKNRELLENNKCNILIAGTLSLNKNQIEAIKIVEELKRRNYTNIVLHICGNGDNEEELKKYVKNNNLSNIVKFMGQVKDLTSFRKKMDIALVCSKSEALGRVTVEAMYYKNVVIGCNTGCTPYIIEDKLTGFLYKYGNYNQAADRIEDIIKNKDKYIKIIDEAQKKSIKKYYNIDYAKLIFKVYDEILKGN